MTATQTLAKGKLPQQKYGSLGITGMQMIHPMGRLFGLICGKPSEGKSCFIQSHPEGFIFNLDCSSTTTPDVKATIWPGINKEGEPINPDGSQAIITQEAINEKIAILIQMKQENKPRPETIFFDSIGLWIRILRDYITRREGKNEWKEMDGRRAWDTLYEMILDTCFLLRRHGYGVYIVCHVVNAKVQLTEETSIIRPELTVTDTFYKRLYPCFEMVAAIQKMWVKERREIPQPDRIVNGKKMSLKPKIVTTEVARHIFCVDSEALAGITKRRVSIPGELVLPHSNGWETILSTYNEHAFATEPHALIPPTTTETKPNG